MIFELAKKEDAIKIAKIHKSEINQGFLSTLPAVFLEKLYLTVIENDFCVVAKKGNEVLGFIAGAADIGKLYRCFLKKYFFVSVFFLLPKIFNIRKIIETLFYPQKESDLLKAELLTIAVKKDFQGQGIAKKMFEVFISEMKNREVKIFKVIAGEELAPAIKFYEHNGFEFSKNIIIHSNKKSKIYLYKIL